MRWALFLLAFVVAPLAQGQEAGTVTITGTVVDDSTRAPLPDTHVFISGSTTGTTVNERGRFRLSGVSSGAKRLYVTRVGYAPISVDLLLPRDTTLAFAFRLTPTVVKAPEVTVSGTRDRAWHKHLERFKRLFIGEVRWAPQCDLENPTALSFDTAWWGKFEAHAAAPLTLTNRALGYRVTYHLRQFEVRGDIVRWHGEPVFEVLTPRDSSETRRWAENRRTAFYGSLRHFMLALRADRLRDEGFRIFRVRRAGASRGLQYTDQIPTTRDRILTLQPDSLAEVFARDALAVHYREASESRAYLRWAGARRAPRGIQVSYLDFKGAPIHVDRHGEIVEPFGVTLHGYFAFRKRMAALLPRGYRPAGATLSADAPSP